jgi:hypothetical protein
MDNSTDEGMIIGYHLVDIYSYEVYIREEFYDAIAETTKGEKLDELLDAVQEKEGIRLQTIFDKVVGKDNIVVIAEMLPDD